MTIEAVEQDRRQDAALAVEFHRAGAVCLLRLTGELRRPSLPVLESVVDHLGRTPFEQVVVDLAHLRGLDGAGARVLTGLHHYVSARGGRLRVVGADDSVRSALAGTPLGAG